MEKKQLFVVFNHEGELYHHETFEEALKDFEAEKDDYEFFIGDEKVYLAKVIKMAYVVEDHERSKVEDPAEHGFEAWVKFQEQHFDEFVLLQQLQQAQQENERLKKFLSWEQEEAQGLDSEVTFQLERLKQAEAKAERLQTKLNSIRFYLENPTTMTTQELTDTILNIINDPNHEGI
jgi:hypothetical protein